MPAENKEISPENPVNANPGIPPGTVSPEKATDPASNVAPFMKAIQSITVFKNEIRSHIDVLTNQVNRLQARIDKYDKFFGGEDPKIPPPVPTQPVVVPPGETPKHIQRGVHNTERNAGGPSSG